MLSVLCTLNYPSTTPEHIDRVSGDTRSRDILWTSQMSCCVGACVSDLSFIFTVPNLGRLVELHDMRAAGVSHPRLIFR